MRRRLGWVLAMGLMVALGPRAAFAQAPGLQWEEWLNTGNEEWVVATAPAADGGMFVGVTTDNGVWGQRVQALMRYTPEGVQSFYLPLGSQWTAIRGLAVDPAGNCYVSGVYYNRSNMDACVAKVSPAGVMIWGNRFDLGGDEWGARLAVDPQGNAYQVQTANRQRHVTRYNSNGTFRWTVRVEEDSDLYPLVGPDGNVLLAQNLPTNSLVFRKLNASTGAQTWVRPYSTPSGCRIRSAAVDGEGCIVATGWAITGSWPDRAWLTVRVLSTGSVHWSRQIVPPAGANGSQAEHVTIGPGNTIFLGGAWYPAPGDLFRPAVAKYTSTGNLAWHTVIPGTANAYATKVSVGADGKPHCILDANGPAQAASFTTTGKIEWQISHNVPTVLLIPQGMSTAPDGTLVMACWAFGPDGDEIVILGFR